MNRSDSRWRCVSLAFVTVAFSVGCERKMYDPAWATRPYPKNLHQTSTVDMQVFRRGQSIEIVNSTARSYSDFDLWVNQRYVRHVDSLPAGLTLKLSLWDFHDQNGDAFNAGGFFRTIEPMPVRLVEIQTGSDAKLIGLITIRAEEIVIKPEAGR